MDSHVECRKNTPPPMGGWNKGLVDMGADRFWAKVDKSGDCWLWLGKKQRNGYGVVSRGPAGQQKCLRAHRFAFALEHGPIPVGLDVCHTCDVRACVRPDHLFLGTRTDNMVDAARKGRAARKMTNEEVREARRRFAGGVTNKVLAASYGITRTCMWAITAGKTRREA